MKAVPKLAPIAAAAAVLGGALLLAGPARAEGDPLSRMAPSAALAVTAAAPTPAAAGPARSRAKVAVSAAEPRRLRKERSRSGPRSPVKAVVEKDPPKPAVPSAAAAVAVPSVPDSAAAAVAADPVTTGAVGRPVARPGAPATALAAPVEAVRGTIEPAPTAAVPAGPPAAPANPVVARAAAFSTEGAVTRFTLDLSAAVAIDVFGLVDPYRVVIDLPETRFDLAAEAGRDGAGPVQSWRFGLFMAGRSRLVFDTAGPVRIVRAAVEPAAADGAARLVLELATASREEFVAAHLRQARPAAVAEGSGILPKGDRQAVRPQRAKPVVVIDPGHGGIDVGTRSPATGTYEKGVVLEISRLLERKLAATGRYEVHMTRTDDSFVALAERVARARQHHADLFLSVHADAEYDRLVRGATVYTLDDRASDSAAAALAAKENASDALAGVVPEETPEEVADILIDLTVRETKRFSHILARNLVDDLKAVGRLVKSNPHRSANFRVLKAHDIPSALVELGFLSNKEDEQLLMSADWRERTTEALVASIDRFFQNRIANAP